MAAESFSFLAAENCRNLVIDQAEYSMRIKVDDTCSRLVMPRVACAG